MVRPFNSVDLSVMIKKEATQEELLSRALLLMEEGQHQYTQLVHLRAMLKTISQETEKGLNKEDDANIQQIEDFVDKLPKGMHDK